MESGRAGVYHSTLECLVEPNRDAQRGTARMRQRTADRPGPGRPARVRRAGPLLAGLALLVPALGTATPAAPRLPDHFTATYDVQAAGQTIGETRWTLATAPEGRYRLESMTRAVGLFSLLLSGDRREASLWVYDPTRRPRPLRYTFEKGGGKPQTASIDFDWAARTATSAYRGKTVTLPLTAGTLDALVYVLALMQDLQSGRPDLTYTLAERGKVKTYVLSREGTETVRTGLGPVEALKLTRVDEEGRRTTLWCAPTLGFLPVQMEHQESGGGGLTLRLRSSEGLSSSIPAS